jgi:DNA-binding NtrC family response regulator
MSLPNADMGEAISTGQNKPLAIIAIDDDPGILKFYQAAMSGPGVEFESSTDPYEAMDLIVAYNPSLVILDVTMPGIDGIELLHRIRRFDARTHVVMITGNYTVDTAAKAIQEGAIDFICKPVLANKLRELVTRVRDLVAREERTRTLEQELAEVSNLEGIIGRSPRMLEIFDLIRHVAPHFRAALITGEAGTGKKIVARALHNLSPGRNQPFTVFNCAALAEGEAGLFGYASGGTAFLDEVGKLSTAAQSKLLHIIGRGKAQEVGLPQAQQVNFQVVASTSQDLQGEAQTGRFQPELWYRLSSVQIHLPALRERMDDVLLLARHFLARFSVQYAKEPLRMSRGAEAALLSRSWPGNVRELEEVIDRACMLATSHTLDSGDLPAEGNKLLG